MSKQKSVNLIVTVLGILLLLSGFLFFRGEEVKIAGGLCVGIGAGMIGLGGSGLCVAWVNKKYPQKARQTEIEYADERNTMIRCKAKARTCDIIQWFILGIAFVTIVMKAPLWMTLTVVGVYLLKTALELYYMGKYQKEN